MSPRVIKRVLLCMSLLQAIILTCATNTITSQVNRQLPIPSPPPENSCTTSGGLLTRPTVCPKGQSCILISFGFPAVDDPTVGTCEVPPDPLVDCSVEFCSSTPTAQAICKVSGEIATCNAWATRRDGSTEKPDCDIICTEECMIPQLVASDGSTYCNQCKLSAASCRANFTFYGPIENPDTCDQPSIFEQADCCIKQNKGCIPVGGKCSTMGSRIKPVPCVKGASCIIDNFGFPATDIPNSGTCKKVKRVRSCSLNLCVLRGASTTCLLRKSNIVTTCGAWSKRSDGGRKPVCRRSCGKCVYPRWKRPKASDGRRYCNFCFLKRKSCYSAFHIYGPVRKY